MDIYEIENCFMFPCVWRYFIDSATLDYICSHIQVKTLASDIQTCEMKTPKCWSKWKLYETKYWKKMACIEYYKTLTDKIYLLVAVGLTLYPIDIHYSSLISVISSTDAGGCQWEKNAGSPVGCTQAPIIHFNVIQQIYLWNPFIHIHI